MPIVFLLRFTAKRSIAGKERLDYPTTKYDSNEVACAYVGGFSWDMSSSQPWSVRFPIKDEAMDVARSQGAHYHADVIHLELKS